MSSSSQIDAVANLLKVLELVRVHGDDELNGWLSAGVGIFLTAQAPLDRGLNLNPEKQGSKPVAKKFFTWKRNIHLMYAWKHCSHDDAIRSWTRSGELEKSVTSFYQFWPSVSDRDEPDPTWSQLRKNLFWVFKYGVMAQLDPIVPHSQRQIHDIVRPLLNVVAQGK